MITVTDSCNTGHFGVALLVEHRLSLKLFNTPKVVTVAKSIVSLETVRRYLRSTTSRLRYGVRGYWRVDFYSLSAS